MTQNQTDRFNSALRGHSVVTVAQIGNLIDACLEGRCTTATVKEHAAWQRLTDAQKAEVSALLNKWVFEADGHKGTTDAAHVKAYYKGQCTNSIISPAKLIV